jgi:hypothetical protein
MTVTCFRSGGGFSTAGVKSEVPRIERTTMNDKEPVLLTIVIETGRMRWLAAGISLDQQVSPLLASHDDDLAGYRRLAFDKQVSFLRHRFCGALQQGCDRLWGIRKKACHFIFLTDHVFPHAPPELTERVAEHLVQWMSNPPITFFSVGGGALPARPIAITPIAGEISAEYLNALQLGLPLLLDAAREADRWEHVPLPKPHSHHPSPGSE